MRSPFPVILLLGLIASLPAQSPHGPDLRINCAECHSSDSWEVNREEISFDHATTDFPLAGQHMLVDCRDCHQTLVFQEAEADCISCHTDMHRMTVGSDCARCHTSDNWLVDDVTGLHLDNGFPLVGAHYTVNCNECHVSESALEFNRIGNECLNCHLPDYEATTVPDHRAANYSVDCYDCHRIDGFDWSAQNISHDFFPLTGGHDITDCSRCHTSDDYQNVPTDCFACHQADYENTADPNHQQLGFGTDCESCHNIAGWSPSTFDHDGMYFPIYSGKHRGEWNDCVECHTTPGSYDTFSCIDCHEHNNQARLADEHDDVSDFVYESEACYMCHPTGEED